MNHPNHIHSRGPGGRSCLLAAVRLVAALSGPALMARDPVAPSQATAFIAHFEALKTRFSEADARRLAMEMVFGSPAAPAVATKRALPEKFFGDVPASQLTVDALLKKLQAMGIPAADARNLAGRVRSLESGPSGFDKATLAPKGNTQAAFVQTLKDSYHEGGADSAVALGAAAAAESAGRTQTNPDLPTTPSVDYSMVTGGIKSVSPYLTKGAEDTTAHAVALDKGKSQVRGYIEFQYIDDWVRNPSNRASTTQDEAIGSHFGLQGTQHWLAPWTVVPHADAFDYSAQVGFNFGDSNSNGYKDANASTIAGGGDFYIRASLGYHLLRHGGERMRFTIGPDLSGGMNTDLGNFDVHSHAMGAVKWSVGFKAPGLETAQGMLQLRIGYAFTDVPHLTTLNNAPAIATDGGRLQFDSMRGGPAFETQLLYPLNDSLMLAIGGRIVQLGHADQWSFNIGMVLPLDRLGALFGFVDAKSKPAAATAN